MGEIIVRAVVYGEMLFLVDFLGSKILMGFRQLVAVMYPIIGYLGMLMLVVLVVASYRKKGRIRNEKEIRNHLLTIIEKFMIQIKI